MVIMIQGNQRILFSMNEECPINIEAEPKNMAKLQ